MGDADRAKWNRKYTLPGYRRGDAPPALLRGVAGALPRSGRALDVACGEGQVLVWLAKRGMEGLGIDVSDVAIRKASALAEREGVAGRVGFLVHDLERGLPPLPAAVSGAIEAGADDGERGGIDVATLIHFHQPDLVPALVELLAPGGLLVVETLTTENEELGLPAPSRRYLAEPGEVLSYAAGLRVRLYRESVIDGTVRAQLLAQKPPGPPPGFRLRNG